MYSEGRQDWTLQLPEISSEEGLQDAKLYRFGNSIELTKANSEQHLLAMEEFAARLAKINKKDEASKLYRIIQEAYKECLQGAALSMPRIVCVARKAICVMTYGLILKVARPNS